MCGIAGTIGVVHHNAIRRMVSSLTHRGPDDEGIFVDDRNQVALGHRRLAIIDRSAAGHQPMSAMQQRYWIVYNGEVYNYRELRNELVSLGHTFRTATDTEVVLTAYIRWGADCVRRFRGMFAFAILDRGPALQTPQLFLARDRLGIKPLYYATTPGALIFASEMKALLASGLVSRVADLSAIWRYLSFGSVPGPGTIIQGVWLLPPGHYALWRPNKELLLTRYWDITSAAVAKQVDPPSTSTLRQLLEDATRLHLISDVPVGAFLSGGIDSTVVVGLMSRLVSHPLRTFSVFFESRQGLLNELPFARQTASRFQTNHCESVVTGGEVGAEWNRIVAAMDQPSMDGVNSYFVSRTASAHVTVAISGLGGDELFAGYPHFRRLQQAARWDCLGRFGKSMLSLLPRRYQTLQQLFSTPAEQRYAIVRSLVPEARKRNLTASLAGPPMAQEFAPWLDPHLDSIAQTTYLEISGHLTNTLLRDTDAMSMAHSLEVRPVLLDHHIAEYAFRLPARAKLSNGRHKRALIEAVPDLLDAPTLARTKTGFEMPHDEWLAGPLRDRVRARFDSAKAAAIFNRESIAELLSSLENSLLTSSQRWAYFCLIDWLEDHRVAVVGA